MTFIPLVLISLIFAIFLMGVAWWLAKKLDFYSLVDVAWAYGLGFIALFYALFGKGNTERRILFCLMGLAWSIRLGTFLFLRLKEKFPQEDTRYQKIKESWGTHLSRNFFWFFQFQALSQPLLAIPFLISSQNSDSLSPLDVLGLAISLLGVAGESISDFQLNRFKADPSNKGKVCDQGLWKYSRHPNYFFEWVIWCGFSLFGLSGSYPFLSLLSPLIMFLLLNYVTGVPPAEEQSLISRGDLFRDYQKRTSRFFPWIPHAK